MVEGYVENEYEGREESTPRQQRWQGHPHG